MIKEFMFNLKSLAQKELTLEQLPEILEKG